MGRKNKIYKTIKILIGLILVMFIGMLIYTLTMPKEEEDPVRIKYITIDYNNYIKSVEPEKIKEENVNESEKIKEENVNELGNKIVYAKITHYCTEQYPHTCNSGDGNYNTATGVPVTPYKTVAVDKSMIPLGSTIIINGQEYIAEDVFGTDKSQYRIDIAVETHQEALDLGVFYTYIEIIEPQ